MVLEPRHDMMGHFMGYQVAQANWRAHALFRTDGRPLLGQSLQDVLPEGQHPSFHLHVQRAHELGQAQSDELMLRPASAQTPPCWLHHQIIPLPTGVVLISRDTTEIHESIKALHEQERFYRTLVDSLPMPVFARSMREHNRGQYVVWNRQAADTMKMPAERVLGQRAEDVMPAALVTRGNQQDQQVLNEPHIHWFNNLTYATPAGELVVDLIKAPVYGADGQMDHILSIALDVTAQRQAAEQLRLASRVIEETGDAVVVSDAQDRVVMVNPAFLKLSGLRADETIGRQAELLGLAPLRDSHLAGIGDALAQGRRWSGESLQNGALGRTIDTWLSVSALRDEDQRQITQHLRVFSDISVLKAQQRELAEQARRDSLTGLPNRRVFTEHLRQAIGRARRHPQSLAVMYVDLDGFKSINDRLGHAAGDRVLAEAALRLQASVRGTDCVCRLAGDEFTVILEGAGHPDEVIRIGQRIIQRLAQPCMLGVESVRIGASVGAALFESHESIDSLCERADAAMYQAKHSGKGRFVLAEEAPLTPDQPDLPPDELP